VERERLQDAHLETPGRWQLGPCLVTEGWRARTRRSGRIASLKVLSSGRRRVLARHDGPSRAHSSHPAQALPL